MTTPNLQPIEAAQSMVSPSQTTSPARLRHGNQPSMLTQALFAKGGYSPMNAGILREQYD